MAKWIFYVVVFVYMCYRAVYGLKIDKGVTVEQINYGEIGFLEVGTRRTINCKASSRNQKLEWVDPFGKVIKRIPSNRIFAQEHFVPNPKGSRNPALVLSIRDLMVSDSGLYQCKSGDQVKSVPLCVIKPSEFFDTPADVAIDVGRSITLTCQAKGDPEPNIIWNRNEHELTEGEEYPKYRVNRKYNSQGYESLLTITSLEPEDAGLYTCVTIQESPMLDNCTHNNSYNITLRVNHEPQFKNVNDTKLVFGQVDEVVDLKCEASGWPKPTYSWFKDLGSGALYEFDKTKFKVTEEPNMAILSVKSGPTTFDKSYTCVATNAFGKVEKRFQLLESDDPRKVTNVDSAVFGNVVLFTLLWDEPINFPIKNFDIQYMEASKIGSRKLKESDWKSAKQVEKAFDQDDYDDDETEEGGIDIKLEDLKPETEYIVRLRATNDIGVAPWSNPIHVTTLEEPDIEVEEETIDNETEDEESTEDLTVGASAVGGDNGTFYGIFFAGAIAIVAVVCMFAMRLV